MHSRVTARVDLIFQSGRLRQHGWSLASEENSFHVLSFDKFRRVSETNSILPNTDVWGGGGSMAKCHTNEQKVLLNNKCSKVRKEQVAEQKNRKESRYVRYSNKEEQICGTLPTPSGRTRLNKTHAQSTLLSKWASCLSSFFLYGLRWKTFHMTTAVNSRLAAPHFLVFLVIHNHFELENDGSEPSSSWLRVWVKPALAYCPCWWLMMTSLLREQKRKRLSHTAF